MRLFIQRCGIDCQLAAPRLRHVHCISRQVTCAAPQAASGPKPQRVAWSTRDALAKKQLKPKKSLGQNFLLREEVLQSITDAACIRPGDSILEIGPGTGNLTRYLLRAGAIVTAVEKDDKLFEGLQTEFSEEIATNKLQLVHGDVLSLQPAMLLSPAKDAAKVRRNKVVANLPYNMTKSILQQLLPLGDHFSDLFLMIQDEVAQRLLAGPGTGQQYRAFNLEVAFYSDPTCLFTVDRTAYFPAPKVDGAVVRFRLQPRDSWPIADESKFLSMVQLAFSERRKMLRNNLQGHFDLQDVSEALVAAGLEPNVRPQQLSLKEYVALWQQLQSTTD